MALTYDIFVLNVCLGCLFWEWGMFYDSDNEKYHSTIIVIRVRFRISLKRGQVQIQGRGNPIIKHRESQLPRWEEGGGESTGPLPS